MLMSHLVIDELLSILRGTHHQKRRHGEVHDQPGHVALPADDGRGQHVVYWRQPVEDGPRQAATSAPARAAGTAHLA